MVILSRRASIQYGTDFLVVSIMNPSPHTPRLSMFQTPFPVPLPIRCAKESRAAGLRRAFLRKPWALRPLRCSQFCPWNHAAGWCPSWCPTWVVPIRGVESRVCGAQHVPGRLADLLSKFEDAGLQVSCRLQGLFELVTCAWIFSGNTCQTSFHIGKDV